MDHKCILLSVSKSDSAMNKIFLPLAFLLIISNFATAQKFGYINSEYILGKMPDYAEKQQELEALAKEYDKEVRSLYNDAEVMRAELRANRVLYTPVMVEEKQAEIDKKAQEALEKSTQLFGYDGLYFKKQKELLQPLREKMVKAYEAVSKKYKLDLMLDKAADLAIVYSNPVHDYTEFVLEELGLGETEN